MLRNVLELKQPLQGAVLNICKQYGTRARAYIEMTGPGEDKTERTIDPPEKKEKHEKHFVYTKHVPHMLHFNVEELNENLQKDYIDRQLEQMKKIVEDNEIRSITFNCIKESIFRSQLNMPIRKLGFESSFQRYNDDRGLAIFYMKADQEITMDNSNMGSYNKRAYAKQYYGLL
ncbi:uncharacterized protein LOC123536413 [Mercenaria mercenaria]|uniref:uncharacterized protein LOC123536413 n=1 Tax=Mercenaria mercenaria TaxID=6596 RepID=UPI001E1DE183|nr:uncharacterized protein LOC123536413 [Mercenaria mercenaria]